MRRSIWTYMIMSDTCASDIFISACTQKAVTSLSEFFWIYHLNGLVYVVYNEDIEATFSLLKVF